MHPVFAGFLLIYIIKRIELGQTIVKAIEETWFNLMVATALLIVFNYLYSIYIYVVWTESANSYGIICQNLFRCLMLLVDQSLKGDSGFLGVVAQQSDYINMVLNMQVLSEIVYILFAQKVTL